VCVGVFIRLSRFYISTFHGSRLFLEGGGCRFKAIIVALILGFVCIYALNRGHIFPMNPFSPFFSWFLVEQSHALTFTQQNSSLIHAGGISFPGYTSVQWLVFNFLIAIKYSPIRWLIKSEPNRYLSFRSTKLKKLLYYFKQHPNWTDIRWLIQSEPNRYLSFRSIKLKKLIYYFKQYSNWTNNWVSY